MSASTTILHGLLDFPISLPKETPRRGALDTVEQTFQTSRKDAFRVDAARSGRISPFPGYSTVFIDEIVCDEEIPGRAYEQKLKGLGLLDGLDRIVSDPTANPEEGWDTGEHEVYTLNPSRYLQKQAHPLIPSLYITDRDVETEIGRIKKLRLGYKGIVPVSVDNLGNPVPKGYKRRLSTTSYTQSTQAPLAVYVFITGVGWVLGSAQNYNFDASRLNVTDSYLSFDPPDYNAVPGNWQPPGVPDELENQSGLSEILGPGTGVPPGTGQISLNRPYGWVLRSYGAEQLFDLPVWLYTLTAEWVQSYSLKLA